MLGVGLAATAATLSLTVFSQATPRKADGRVELAQAETFEDGETAKSETKSKSPRPAAPKPKPRTEAKADTKGEAKPEPKTTDAQRADAGKPATPPTTLAGAAAAGANTAALNISAKLSQNGAGACAAAIDGEAASSMVGVTESNTLSQWSNVEPRDRHAASVFIGQRYGQSPAVPFGITGLIASPTSTGSCDVTSVQVVSSPLPCGKVRETLARSNRVLGEIVGMPVISTNGGQTMLMPTATNTCVLVAFNSKFGN